MQCASCHAHLEGKPQVWALRREVYVPGREKPAIPDNPLAEALVTRHFCDLACVAQFCDTEIQANFVRITTGERL